MTCALHLAVAFLIQATPVVPLHVKLGLIEHTYRSAKECEFAKASLMRDGALMGAAADGWCVGCK